LGKKADLHTQATEFARKSLENLLNRTITKGIPIGAARLEDGRSVVGYGVSKHHLYPSPIPITVSAAEPRCYLYITHTMFLASNGYPAVAVSSYALYLGEAGTEDTQLFRYDYERDKKNYPVAHIQFYGESAPLQELLKRAKRRAAMEDLHWPVGGKRYRPSLEDIIEFLIQEQLVESHTDWDKAVREHRDEFHRKQLSAAVFNDPDTAIDALDELGYGITPPLDE
jgi:hypothetical protein